MRLSRLTNRQLRKLINSGHISFATLKDSDPRRKLLLKSAQNYRKRVNNNLANDTFKTLYNTLASVRNNPSYKKLFEQMVTVKNIIKMLREDVVEMAKEMAYFLEK